MKTDIRDIFDGYIDDENIDIYADLEDIDMKKVRRMTLDRVENEHKRKASKKIRVLLIAAALMVVFGATVYAAVSGITYRHNIGEQTYSFEVYTDKGIDELVDCTYEVGTEVTVAASSDHSKLYGFKASYLPELGKIIDTQNNIFENGISYYLINACEKGCYSIAIYSPKRFDTKYVIYGKSAVVKEDMINGMAATFIDSDHGDGCRVNIIVMRDEKTGALCVVTGDIGFDELKKTAEGIEIIKTDRENMEADYDFGGLIGLLNWG